MYLLFDPLTHIVLACGNVCVCIPQRVVPRTRRRKFLDFRSWVDIFRVHRDTVPRSVSLSTESSLPASAAYDEMLYVAKSLGLSLSMNYMLVPRVDISPG